MTRSKKKGLFIVRNPNALVKSNSPLRKCVIHPFLVGTTLEFFNGIKKVNLKITDNLVGHRFGEFIKTRKFNKK